MAAFRVPQARIGVLRKRRMVCGSGGSQPWPRIECTGIQSGSGSSFEAQTRVKYSDIMVGRYTLKVTTDFAASHSLEGYPGNCSRLHGHNWRIDVEADATSLDDLGMGIDFKILKDAARSVANTLDHCHLNDVPPFDTLNPTAENIAAYVFQEISQIINDDRVRICAITLWETDRACVRYTEGEHESSH